MLIRSLVPGLMLILLLGAQSSIPSLANASDCCPCSNPCMAFCFCRANGTHCPSCRAGEPNLSQFNVEPITATSGFYSDSEPLAIALPTSDLSGKPVALARGGYRAMGDPHPVSLQGPSLESSPGAQGLWTKALNWL